MKDSEVVDGFHTYKESADKNGLDAKFAVYSKEKGFAYCHTEADSAQQVWDAHKQVKIPLEEVIEIKQVE